MVIRRDFLATLFWTPIARVLGQDALPGPGFKYQYGNRFVGCYFGEIRGFGGLVYTCYFLESGELVIDYNHLPPFKWDAVSIRDPKTLYDPVKGMAENVLEYRTARLISGTIKQHKEEFVPDLGTKVSPFDSYKEGMHRIYNLPGFFAKRRAESSDGFYNREKKMYSMSDNHKALLRTSVDPLPAHYFHKKLKDKLGEHVCFGYVLDNGNFNYDLKYGIIRDPDAIRKLQLPPNLYASRDNEEWVYEFRSERLILGKLTGDAFVPELGSTIESYNDYKNKKLKSLRIYNLPKKYKQ